MKRELVATRATLAWAVLTASLLASGLLAASPTSAATTTTTYTATTSVNVRTGASTSQTILFQLQKGQSVLAAGKVSGDWLPITYDNTTAYVWAEYLTADKTAASLVLTGPAGRRTALANVNVRATASLDADITAILDEGTAITVTGYSSGAFAQVTVDGTTGWVHTQFLSTTTDTTPVAVARYTTTTDLALRTTASVAATNQGTISSGSTVGGTGTHSGTYSQVVYDGKVGWVITGYLDAVSGTTAAYVLPLRKATLYGAKASVPIRSAADATSTELGTITLGFAIRTTGTTDGIFTQVIWNGSTAWARTSKLTATATVDLGSDSLNKLEPYGKAAVLEVRANFPKITTIYGWRSSSAYSSDHPNGRAIDIMIPSYKSNKALGDSIAQYFIDNGKRLHVTYILWRQRSYTLSRGSWKAMEDRGSDTQNHMNHVHVSFEPS
ncbi:MAG: SH3 domain-containing protein [Propionicimonas sp.]|uniref:SH3 domain-containing protein n=1 Tax=Propionicimonas sp. TaxID=1955623 RepID=UPI003D09C83E